MSILSGSGNTGIMTHMAKFMNAELIKLRDGLECGHCHCTFKGSDSQAWKVKYEKRTVYCSESCRYASMRNKFCTPIPNRGPCKTCGLEFFSRTAKLYCSIDCYVTSDQFRAMQQVNITKTLTNPEVRAKISAKLKTGEMVPCLECGQQIYKKRKSFRKFCSTVCYRSYLAKRFDRWVANPEGMALPQCYDEFLDREELPCIVGDCNWRGAHLTLHVNQMHGLKAEDFKRASGFNLHTGVIARPLAELLQCRDKVGVAIATPWAGSVAGLSRPRNYQSREGVEHRKKAMALARAGSGPERQCRGCAAIFQQTTPFGRTVFHSIECREEYYRRRSRSKAKPRARNSNGTFSKN